MRRNDWPARMYAVIEDHRRCAYAYGSNDCAQFVARCVDAMTGSNLVETILAEYHDEASAQDLISRHGSIEAAAIHFLGEPSTERATRGDVVSVDGGAGLSVGIWDGKQVVCMGERGLMCLPRSEIRKVWKV